jgi:anthranilate synthase component 1
MEIIDQYEKGARGIYGGAIGYLTFGGEFNHAILIRSFLSKGNFLYYQAAGGIVADSIHQNELEEVGNKLRALRKALILAETLGA